MKPARTLRILLQGGSKAAHQLWCLRLDPYKGTRSKTLVALREARRNDARDRPPKQGEAMLDRHRSPKQGETTLVTDPPEARRNHARDRPPKQGETTLVTDPPKQGETTLVTDPRSKERRRSWQTPETRRDDALSRPPVWWSRDRSHKSNLTKCLLDLGSNLPRLAQQSSVQPTKLPTISIAESG